MFLRRRRCAGAFFETTCFKSMRPSETQNVRQRFAGGSQREAVACMVERKVIAFCVQVNAAREGKRLGFVLFSAREMWHLRRQWIVAMSHSRISRAPLMPSDGLSGKTSSWRFRGKQSPCSPVLTHLNRPSGCSILFKKSKRAGQHEPKLGARDWYC